MSTKPGLIPQYLSTNLILPLNRSSDAFNYFASFFLLTIIIIIKPRLFPLSYYSISWALFISQRERVFSYILIDAYTSRLNISILLSPKYQSTDIPCTLRHNQYSNISTPVIDISMIFATQINMFNNREINSPALAF